MGHTLVTRFDSAGHERLQALLDGAGIAGNNKIPFGRDCDRRAANEVLPYHVTVFHWAKADDARFLRALEDFRFRPCRVRVTGVEAFPAEAGSRLLMLTVAPDAGYDAMRRALEAALGRATAGFLHITLSADLDAARVEDQRAALARTFRPFALDVEGLDLYHIWRPTRFVRAWRA